MLIIRHTKNLRPVAIKNTSRLAQPRFAVHELQLGGIAGDLHRLHRCRVEILQHSELEQTCSLFGTHLDLHFFTCLRRVAAAFGGLQSTQLTG